MSRTNTFGFERFACDVTAMTKTCLKPYAVSLEVALPANHLESSMQKHRAGGA
jgi:hypothetical protein